MQYDGTRTRAGAARSDRSQGMQEIERDNPLSERDIHTTGRMYDNAVATPYDPHNLFDRSQIWFEPAKHDPVLDCLGHAFNYMFRFPLFTDREQLFKLALTRGKRSKDYTTDRKMKAG